jgi:Lon protease-like protein
VSEEVLDLALFPLNTVLFPGMKLPLHIFEDRYRLMIRECLRRDRDFGVLMAGLGTDHQGMSATDTIGTSARITHVDQLQDGRMDIVTTGAERFRLLHLLHTEPYVVGRVEVYPLGGADSPLVSELVCKASTLFVRYLRLVSEVIGATIQLEGTPRNASDLAYAMAITLKVSMEEKQELLNIGTLPALLAREVLILSREEVLLNRMQEAQDNNTGYVQALTQYLSLS